MRVDDDAAVRAQRLARRTVGGHLRARLRARRASASAPVRRDQHRARVGIVLGLRDQIGRDPRPPDRVAATMTISVGPA